MYFKERACQKVLTFYNNAAKLVQFRDPMLMQRFTFFQSLQSEHPQKKGDETRGGGGSRENEERGGKTQAGRRDKAIALHCQSGEAINNSVTIKRERGRESRRERVGCIKETQQNPVRRVLHLAGH